MIVSFCLVGHQGLEPRTDRLYSLQATAFAVALRAMLRHSATLAEQSAYGSLVPAQTRLYLIM